MKESDIVSKAERVMDSTVDKEAVILGIESGQYIGLNETGTRIWELIDHPLRIVEIIDQLEMEFDAPREIIRGEVLAFLADLETKSLIVVNTDHES